MKRFISKQGCLVLLMVSWLALGAECCSRDNPSEIKTCPGVCFSESCPTDFTLYPSSNRCFKYSAAGLDFVSAERSCRSYGASGHIAIFDSPELSTWIIDTFIAGTSTGHLWVGVNDLEENGVYKNNDGSMASLEHSYQGAGMWTHSVREGCLRGTVSLDLEYFDTECRYGHQFVCEVEDGDDTAASLDKTLMQHFLSVSSPQLNRYQLLKSLPLDQFECASMCGRYEQCGAYYMHPETGACTLLKYSNWEYTFPANAVLHQMLLV